jgi:serine/threonine protein kinase
LERQVELPARIGRYEVELLLGEGGHARVLLAHDPVLRRQVALKILRDDLKLSPEQHGELTERVRQEVRAASTLSHPGLVALHDLGDDQRVGLYFVFELVHGPTMRERLQDGPLPAAEVAQIARAVGSALTHAHVAGLVHRGVRPENIMLAPTGPKLTDVGISPSGAHAPSYSAPEVLASGSFTTQGDEFSFASTMYEALTGKRAFSGDEATAIAAKVASGKYPSPRSALPTLRGFLRLDAVFARGLAKDPRKRFPSCEAFGSALAAELEGPRVTFLATPASARTGALRRTRRWQNGIAIVAVVVILALVLIGRFRQPSAADGASPKNEPARMDPGASMQRVVPKAHPVRPPASSSPSPSTAGAASSVAPPHSSSIPVIDP